MRPPPARSVLKLALLAALVASLALLVSSRPELASPDRLREAVVGAGPWVYVLYVALWALAFVIPATLLDLAGALLFGLFPGVLLVLLGSTFGGAVVYGASRGLGREFVEAALGGRLEAIDRRVSRNGFRGVLFVRLVPFFPYIGVNYAAGFLKVPLRPYLAATAIGMFPASFVFTYFFATLGERALQPGSIRAGDLASPGFAVPMLLFFSFLAVTWLLRKRLWARLESP